MLSFIHAVFSRPLLLRLTIMIQGLKKIFVMVSSIHHRENCLKCGIRIFTYGIERKMGVILRHKLIMHTE